MPRLRSIKISALNITLHPHSPEKYITLLKDVKSAKNSFRYKANHYALLGTLNEIKRGSPLDGIHGLLYRFIDFDRDEPWLNVSTQKQANEDDLEQVLIPDNLKPGLIMTRYVFFPKKHRLFFESKAENGKSMGASTAKKIFSGLFNQVKLIEKYGEITVITEPSREGIDKIFAIPKLERLSLEICRPNADDLEDAEKKVLDRLTKQNAKREDLALIAEKGLSLDPDKEMKMLSQIAAANGKVTGKGKDENDSPLHESTVDHPWSETFKFNPAVQDAFNAFMQKAREILPTFTDRLKIKK